MNKKPSIILQQTGHRALKKNARRQMVKVLQVCDVRGSVDTFTGFGLGLAPPTGLLESTAL